MISGYFSKVEAIYQTGQATEHSYRSALEGLFSQVSKEIRAINEPKAVKVGRPDFVINRGDITIGWCEAKDIGLDINPKAMTDSNKSQFQRYVKAFPNLIYTNCLDFRFYKNGELIREISIADYLMGIQAKPDQFEILENQLKDFVAERMQTIRSSKNLAAMMAAKAILVKDILHNSLQQKDAEETELFTQYTAFKEQLIHDLPINEFADIYAETIAYGMFAARLHDTSLKDFSRQEALELLPKSNPFLRNLFSYIAGPNLDGRIKRTVDELADIFQATDLAALFKDFGKFTQRNDPFIHFYETFLSEYNPKKRKARGVWYTPEAVVNFIVRAVDEVLQEDFGLPMGLADTSKVTIDWDTGQKELTKKGTIKKSGKNLIEKKEVHRVQILDPATGTGTFLAEVIKQVAPKIKEVAAGSWDTYVEQELVPRMHGFELLMASYAMCHMKLDMMLTELGYKPTKIPPRLSVYLTNSLEEGEAANQTLPFAQWLSNEVKQANAIKRDMPIMCIVGNPPYSVSSSNKSEWIESLMTDYKKDLNERNIQPLSDDYIKFIRFSQHFIERNGEGILGFITNNSYLDGLIHRQMRKTLLEGFDKIYVLDLHGSSKKKEVAPDGTVDKNVFDIQQGVSIIIAVKTTPTPHNDRRQKQQILPQAQVYHADVWGARQDKYDALFKGNLSKLEFNELAVLEPNYYFVPKDFDAQEIYEEGFRIDTFMQINGSGIKFRKDNLLVAKHFDQGSVIQMINDIAELDKQKLLQKYSFSETKDWILDEQRKNFIDGDLADICKVNYRPFDLRYAYYPTNRINKIIPRGDSRRALMRHILAGENLAIAVSRQQSSSDFQHIIATNDIQDMCLLSSQTKENGYCFPLYLYPGEDELYQTRRVNFEPKIHKSIIKAARDDTHGEPDEVEIFDYIYGVLHCPDYREAYREFLKIDFPRIPYPASPEVFWKVSEQGNQLRRLHLMEEDIIGETPHPFSGAGESLVEKIQFQLPTDHDQNRLGKVYINEDQCFENVPRISWDFYIGGYQPAQKWLKDRKGRQLTFDDIRHYQKIIKILSETDRLMKLIEFPIEDKSK